MEGGERQGEQETAGSGSRYKNRSLWEAEPSKVICLPFNAHTERKFPIRFFIASKVIDAMSLKLNKFVGLLQAVSVETFPATKVSQVKCRQTA